MHGSRYNFIIRNKNKYKNQLIINLADRILMLLVILLSTNVLFISTLISLPVLPLNQFRAIFKLATLKMHYSNFCFETVAFFRSSIYLREYNFRCTLYKRSKIRTFFTVKNQYDHFRYWDLVKYMYKKKKCSTTVLHWNQLFVRYGLSSYYCITRQMRKTNTNTAVIL